MENKRKLRFVASLFARHVFEFTGLEDFATFDAFHIFVLFVTRHDLDARMFARLGGYALGHRWRDRSHKSGCYQPRAGLANIPEFGGILARLECLSSKKALRTAPGSWLLANTLDSARS